MRDFRPTQLLALSFFVIIMAGTSLLMLPCSANGQMLTFYDALFSATSATCVTGLSVIDIGTRLTFFGQIVLLALIQIGGLGILTLSSFFIYLLFGQLSIFNREIIQESLTQQPIKNFGSFLKVVIASTLIIEIIGAVILTLRFLKHYPMNKAAYFGIFHSISAFCNAGFSPFSNNLENYKGDLIVNVTVMTLIILGGLGFIVLMDLKQGWKGHKRRFMLKLSFHTKIVLVVTTCLVIGGALIFYLLELKNSLIDHPQKTKILVSFFQSVTSRTAGYNTINIGSLLNTTLFLLILLMFIGGSPGSCAGGIKTTTFFLLIIFLIARFKNQEDVNVFNRRIPQQTISKIFSITFFSMIIIILAAFLLDITELVNVSPQQSRGSFLEFLFETVSAFGTVGLSTGVTPHLTNIGKVIVSIVMFIGRVGPLTIALAVAEKKPLRYKYPEEDLLVG
jgi:trk system potassium uptake protein